MDHSPVVQHLAMLAEQVRLDIIILLCKHERPLTPLVISCMLERSPATISHHLMILERSGMVFRLRSGRNVLYSPDRAHLRTLGMALLALSECHKELYNGNTSELPPLPSEGPALG